MVLQWLFVGVVVVVLVYTNKATYCPPLLTLGWPGMGTMLQSRRRSVSRKGVQLGLWRQGGEC